MLGVETATWTASVGVVDGREPLAELTRAAAGTHATSLIPLIRDVLVAAAQPLSALDLFAVSIGPGSFTGLRIGLSVAKGLAMATAKPVVGVPTLTALAHVVGPRAHTVYPVLDARKREVYAAAFESPAGRPERLWGPEVLTPEALAERLRPPCVLCGDGVDEYESIFRQRLGGSVDLLPSSRLAPSALAVALLGAERFRRFGADDVAALEPAYIRPCEAEQKRVGSY